MKLFSESITRNWMINKSIFDIDIYLKCYRNHLFNRRNSHFIKMLEAKHG